MNTIAVSVIIPIYNAQEYLRECLSSMREQTLQNIEIIMVNDGSTDKSEEICKEFANKDARFILLTQENGGSAAARKNGMEHAKGEYIGFIDADDWAENNMFEKMYAVAKQHDVDIVFCNCYRDDSNGHSLKCNKYIRDGYYNRNDILQEILPRTLAGLDKKGRNHVIRWANYLRIYRRELIEKHGIYNDPRFRRCQDLQITFEATLHAQSYYYMSEEYLYHNRVVKDSQSRGYTKNQWQKIRILIEKLYEDVDSFVEINLEKQMDLCAFFFAVYSCANEGKKVSGMSKKEHMENLRLICEDKLTERYLRGIDIQKLSKVNRKYYEGLKAKNVNLLWNTIKMEQQEKNKHQLKEKILSIKYVRSLYLKFR